MCGEVGGGIIEGGGRHGCDGEGRCRTHGMNDRLHGLISRPQALVSECNVFSQRPCTAGCGDCSSKSSVKAWSWEDGDAEMRV